MRRAFGEKFYRRGRRGCGGRCFFGCAGIFFGPGRNNDMFLLHFGIFSKVMFFAGAAENQRNSGNGSGGLANTKMHSAPQTNRACAS